MKRIVRSLQPFVMFIFCLSACAPKGISETGQSLTATGVELTQSPPPSASASEAHSLPQASVDQAGEPVNQPPLYPVLAEWPTQGIVFAEKFIWGTAPDLLQQELVPSLVRKEAQFSEEQVKEIFLGDATISAQDEDENRFENGKGVLLLEKSAYDPKRLSYSFSPAVVRLPEEERQNMQGRPLDYFAKAQEALAPYFPDRFLQHPVSINVFFDYDLKEPYVEAEDQPIDAQSFIVRFEQYFDNGLLIDESIDRIDVLFFSDELSDVSFSLYRFEAVGVEKTQAMPFEQAISLLEQALSKELQDADEKQLLWRAGLCYSNMTNIDGVAQDLGKSPAPEQYDLHWLIQSSERNYYINCVDGSLWAV